jgi:hypothetical protein
VGKKSRRRSILQANVAASGMYMDEGSLTDEVKAKKQAKATALKQGATFNETMKPRLREKVFPPDVFDKLPPHVLFRVPTATASPPSAYWPTWPVTATKTRPWRR